MKITKDYLRKLVVECMHDMAYPQATNMAPPMQPMQGMGMQQTNIDPDGYEGRMAKGNLFKAAEAASMLHNLIQDNENLEPWVEEKIAVASQMLDSVANYLKYEKVRGQ